MNQSRIFDVAAEFYGYENLSSIISNLSLLMAGPTELPNQVLIMPAVLYVILFIAGMVGNLFVIAFTVVNRKLWNNMTFLYLNLSIADVFVLVVCVPIATADLFAKDVWYLGKTMCKYKITYVAMPFSIACHLMIVLFIFTCEVFSPIVDFPSMTEIVEFLSKHHDLAMFPNFSSTFLIYIIEMQRS